MAMRCAGRGTLPEGTVVSIVQVFSLLTLVLSEFIADATLTQVAGETRLIGTGPFSISVATGTFQPAVRPYPREPGRTRPCFSMPNTNEEEMSVPTTIPRNGTRTRWHVLQLETEALVPSRHSSS
ncbi:hypothetical protein EYF80_034474 [Liparis tanakae]|uniref:Uncharacterized protein n=1 Tax=Liparis tanakae TaxID=230148 RepID=A0A4Z2GRJ3_9TELE|nr:hypothetical protein EYF80_034474 [Liparis tanakae]